MFSRQHLDSPPPQSQFRRPWSPDPYDPYPSVNRSRNTVQDPYFSAEDTYDSNQDYSRYPPHPLQLPQQHREPSDPSVEALDLADYARTLRPQRNWQPEPETDILDSLHLPSLISRGGTLSSASHSSVRSPAHRPFSLPPSSPRHSPYSSRNAPPTSFRSHNYPYLTMDEPDIVTHSETDLSQFPPWSRNWYNQHDSKSMPSSPPDIYTPLPGSFFDTKRQSGGVFDPNHTLKPGSYSQFPYDSYSSSYGRESNRELLPWSSDPPEYGPVIDESLKAERVRMLEREFGPNARSTKSAKNNDFLDENGNPIVGTVDSKGNLVTQGPKKRVATRVLQIICACAAAIPSIYAAALIKPNPAAPPAGTMATYVLYVVSVISLLALLFLFMIYPCCIRRKKGSGVDGTTNPFANGMMVLPVQGLPGGKKDKKAKGGKGKKGKGANMGGGDVQVNLIVDPNMFGGNREEEEEEEEEDDGTWDWEGSSVPGGWGDGSSNGVPKRKRKRAAKRRSVFAGLAMEEQWKKARSFAKKIMAFDIFGVILWGAVFVIILLGKRCPIGGFDGWCNAYNVSSAAACLLCFLFGLSVFFDIKDLHMSKASPRTRM
ncbi:hypothetical protein GYMLUDRAFT_44589 [Collybiopsis luxurians FD-317 M1]|uniref:Uncharacterized protein n=1 Tax=Collybiopsis luxurians FD-317 M1 TaxID=944289 RepID=A0A0D0B7Y0_9AGAR|nr:hypothetical protein GYMLUDRAFT_44589 [Collybiopsis luxurians FD-317 M1]